jgi:WD40 repeat protein
MIFEKHHGPVLSISCSPFNNRIFLTGSTDGQIRMYDVQDKKQIVTFEPSFGEYIMSIEWSPVRPAVFAAVTNSGSLYIYDLVKSKHNPAEIIKYT